MKRFIFNNYYILRHDEKRTFILSQGASIATPKHLPVNTYWQSMVHPVYAMMLAFFSTPTTIVDACENISRFMQVDKKTVYSFINNFESGKTKCARFEKRNVQKSGKTKRSKNFAHTTL